MWLVLSRAPQPDAPYWPGRRVLAVIDAVVWPAGWVVLATRLPQPAGVIPAMLIALAVLSVLGRLRRAVRENHRYHFTTWRWGRLTLGLLLIGLVLKLTWTP